MKSIVLLCALGILWNAQPIIFNFNNQKSDTEWQIINDGVMGGLSKGRAVYTDSTVQFRGTVSLENNGGFTSFRTPFGKYDLTPYTTMDIRYRSTGQAMGFSLEHHYQFYLPNYKFNLPNTEGNWQTLTVKLSDFKEYRLGNPTGGKLESAVLAKIKRLGFITTEKKPGAFTIETDYIKFY